MRSFYLSESEMNNSGFSCLSQQSKNQDFGAIRLFTQPRPEAGIQILLKVVVKETSRSGAAFISIGCRCVIVRARQRVGPIGQPYTVFIS